MPFLDEIATWEAERVFVRPDDEFGLPGAADLLGRAAGRRRGVLLRSHSDARRRPYRLRRHRRRRTALRAFGPPPVLGGAPFEVQLVSTGEVLSVPADESALEVIRERQPGVGYSCRQGFCGTWQGAGAVRHTGPPREPAHTQEREDHMLICVSRADGGRLILDL